MINKKKIIFFIPNIEKGGIEKNFLILTKYFSKKNYVVEVLYSQISKEIFSQINKKIILKKSKNYIKVFNLFFSNRITNSINCFLYFISKLKKEKNSILFSMQDHPFAIILSKIKNIKCIIRIANHPSASIFFFNNKIISFIKLFIKIFFYKFSDYIICNSKSSALFIKKRINNNIVTIYNPIVIKKLVKKKKKNFLLSVGRLENQKNFLGLIDAFNIVLKSFPKFNLIIVGSGSQKKILVEKINKLKINKNVVFKKYINPHKFLSTSKVLILNSYFEGMPNVLLEALNYKIPIISTNCESGPKEILKNGKYGYLVPINNYLLLSKKITYVLKNYNDATIKATQGHQSLYRFNHRKQCEKYLQIINSL